MRCDVLMFGGFFKGRPDLCTGKLSPTHLHHPAPGDTLHRALTGRTVPALHFQKSNELQSRFFARMCPLSPEAGACPEILNRKTGKIQCTSRPEHPDRFPGAMDTSAQWQVPDHVESKHNIKRGILKRQAADVGKGNIRKCVPGGEAIYTGSQRKGKNRCQRHRISFLRAPKMTSRSRTRVRAHVRRHQAAAGGAPPRPIPDPAGNNRSPSGLHRNPHSWTFTQYDVARSCIRGGRKGRSGTKNKT